MSAGRVELGLGAGWYEAEHDAYGIGFPPLGERFDRLEEQLEIITGLWATPVGETFDSPGGHYPVTASPALPKPVQLPVPIVIGGGGPRRTPALAARFASEFNVPFVPVEFFTAQCDRVRAACEAIDRDPATMSFSIALVLCCGADEAEVVRRAAAIGREPDELRENGAAGTPGEVAARLRSWADAGADRIYLQLLDLADLDHLDLVAEQVTPHLA
jgi:alkanesulfonate monooxygenase SsuD/methylene tetrahydromethanopterin reductase-like flavin-dependent oxidoreductase (luciferase family)